MNSISKYQQKQLRALAREKLGLSKNAPLKTIIKELYKFSDEIPASEKIFYKQMIKFQDAIKAEKEAEKNQKAKADNKNKLSDAIKKDLAKIEIVKVKKEAKEKAKNEIKEKKEKAKNETKKTSELKTILNSVVVLKPKAGAKLKPYYYALKNKMGKNVIIELIGGEGKDEYNGTFNVLIPNNLKAFYKWFDSRAHLIIMRSSDSYKWIINSTATEPEDPNNLKIYIYESKKIIPIDKIKQHFKDGSVNCVLKPIEQWAKCKFEESKSPSAKSRYNQIIKNIEELKKEIGNNGADENMVQKISDTLQIDISIEKPLIVKEQNNKYVFEAKSNRKPLKHFILRNTRIDHVDLNEYTFLNNIEEVGKSELNQIKNQLIKSKTYFTFTKDMTGINSISTLEKTYKLANLFNELCEYFEIEYGLNNCYIDHINDEDLSEFVISSTHYNGTIDFKNVEAYRLNEDYSGINHYDMETAYTQFKQCSFYSGFLGKITDFRQCDKIEGVGIYKIDNLQFTNSKFEKLNNKMNIYRNNCEYPSCELEYLYSVGCTFDVICGCWGVDTLDFDFGKDMFLKYDQVDGEGGIKGYAKYVGKCNSINLNKKYWINGNDELANIIKHDEIGKVETFYNGEICLSYPKKNVFHFSQLTSFITAYQRIQVLQQLMTMNPENLIRVCVDGIYYEGEETFNYPFVDKSDKMNFNNGASDTYISSNSGVNIPQNNKREHNNKELHIGEGGNGKTHFNLLDKGLCRVLYVAPSHKLASKKKMEYDVNVEVWANILTTDPEKINRIKQYYNVLIIDEVSMMMQKSKQYIFKTYSNMKLIFCGDIGYQAPPFSKMEEVIEIDNKGFDKVIEYKKNYRFKCDKLKSFIFNLRDFIKDDVNDFCVNDYVRDQFNTVNDDYVKENYKIEDMILSRSHETKNKYTEYFNELNKWYVTKNDRHYHNGDIIIGEKPNTECEIRHSFTIHSIQGETAENKIYINMDNVYDKRLLYTAISRAQTIEQIIIIKN